VLAASRGASTQNIAGQAKNDPPGLLALCWSGNASIAVDLYCDGTAPGERKLDQNERERPGQNIERARYQEKDCLHKKRAANQPAPAGNEVATREGDQKKTKVEKQEFGLDHIREHL